MPRRASHRRARAVGGFTLLEVMLSMAIALLVLAAVTSAIGMHLRVVNEGRVEVERAQLARALLRRMADDLRATLNYEEIDLSTMIPASSSSSRGGQSSTSGQSSSGQSSGQSSSGQSSSGQSSSGQSSTGQSSTGQSSTGQSTSGQTSQGSQTSGTSSSGTSATDLPPGEDSTTSGFDPATSDPSTMTAYAIPGLYGNQYQIQIDVSRLPRVDQYQQILAADPTELPPDRGSDVKTVAYYVLDPLTMSTGLDATSAGLEVRRQFDRAASLWSATAGGAVEMDQRAELIAPEVAALELMYFDGVSWLTEWDSSVYKCLPLAVQISISLATPEMRETMMPDEYPVYRLIVRIPAAKLPKPTTTAEGTEGTETTSGNGSSGQFGQSSQSTQRSGS